MAFDPVSLAIMAGLSLGSAALSNKGKKGTPGGAQVITMPQFSFTEPRLRLTSDFISDQLTSINQGNFPKFFENQIPTIREGLERPLNTRFTGRTGDRSGSILDQVRSAGAATGVGPKATLANTNKALQRFEEQSKQIDEFIAQQGIDTTRSLIPTLLQGSAFLPQGPRSTVVNVPGTGPQQSAASQALSSLAGNQAFVDNLSGGARSLIESFGGSSGGGFNDVFMGPDGQFIPSAPPPGFNFQNTPPFFPSTSGTSAEPITIEPPSFFDSLSNPFDFLFGTQVEGGQTTARGTKGGARVQRPRRTVLGGTQTARGVRGGTPVLVFLDGTIQPITPNAASSAAPAQASNTPFFLNPREFIPVGPFALRFQDLTA